MGKNKCLFNIKWKNKFTWVREVKGNLAKNLCSSCNKVIDIGMMGKSPLKSHKKGEKHKAAIQSDKVQLNSFFNSSTSFVKDANPPAKDNQSTSVKDTEQMTVLAPPDGRKKTSLLLTLQRPKIR